jgi:Domain of unknown function (DUF4145)
VAANSIVYVSPETSKTAFNCPHCHALANQTWFQLYGRKRNKGSTPTRLDDRKISEIVKDIEGADAKSKASAFFHKVAEGSIISSISSNNYPDISIYNLELSCCFNCDAYAVWVNHSLMWPARIDVPLPNSDLPDDVKVDYIEAGSIVEKSPRGSAALLRLCVQKLCKILGGKGKNIDDDIALLVKNGLDPRVQQALDVVRVIGNNAVHPGAIDLRDDRSTAEKLFSLVNLIAEIMITQPKHVAAMYDSLPARALDSIARRDATQ